MKKFADIKAVLYNKKDDQSEIASSILDTATSKGKKIIIYNDDRHLDQEIEALKKIYKSKEVLILKKFMGRKFQKCPGSPNVICCNYYLLNTCFNCLYDCTYCFLNSYLNSYGIVQFTNLDELVPLIREYSVSSDKIVRVGTGEFTDSLMFDEVTGISRRLINSTSDISNLYLEFKTKSDNINHILDIENKGNSVLAWSLNTDENIKKYESGASLLDARINAASVAQKHGFYTAFHFDPIIKYEGSMNDYIEIVDRIFNDLDADSIVWISLGCFRYSSGFKDIIKHSYPEEELTLEEMVPGIDGKYRYLKKERIKIFQEIIERIKFYTSKPFIYLCMEGEDMWKDLFNADYKTSDDLENAFSDHLKNNFCRF